MRIIATVFLPTRKLSCRQLIRGFAPCAISSFLICV